MLILHCIMGTLHAEMYLAMYTHIILAIGISMEELHIRGFHVYQDNWTLMFGKQLIKMT